MAVQYRKLTENDLETFIEMRIRQLREEGATEEIDLEPALFDYYRRHMAAAVCRLPPRIWACCFTRISGL